MTFVIHYTYISPHYVIIIISIYLFGWHTNDSSTLIMNSLTKPEIVYNII